MPRTPGQLQRHAEGQSVLEQRHQASISASLCRFMSAPQPGSDLEHCRMGRRGSKRVRSCARSVTANATTRSRSDRPFRPVGDPCARSLAGLLSWTTTGGLNIQDSIHPAVRAIDIEISSAAVARPGCPLVHLLEIIMVSHFISSLAGNPRVICRRTGPPMPPTAGPLSATPMGFGAR